MARQHSGTAVISEGHKEVVNIRTAGAASKSCSADNAIHIRILIRPNTVVQRTIRIRPSSLKPLFGTSLNTWFTSLNAVVETSVFGRRTFPDLLRLI